MHEFRSRRWGEATSVIIKIQIHCYQSPGNLEKILVKRGLSKKFKGPELVVNWGPLKAYSVSPLVVQSLTGQVAPWLILIIIIWCVIFPPITKVNTKYKTKQLLVTSQLEADDWCIILILLDFSSQMEFQESWLGCWAAGSEMEMIDLVLLALGKKRSFTQSPPLELV